MNKRINVRMLRIMPYSMLIKAVMSAVLPVGLLAEAFVVRQNGGSAAGLAPVYIGADTACIIPFAMLAICLVGIRGLSRRYDIAAGILVLCIVMFSALLTLTTISKYISGFGLDSGLGHIDTLITGLGFTKEILYYLAVMFVMHGTAEALTSCGDDWLASSCRKTGAAFVVLNTAAKVLTVMVFRGGPEMMSWPDILRGTILMVSEIVAYILLGKAAFVLWRSLTVRAGRGVLHGK